MSPRAIAVHAAIASATWLVPFLGGCSVSTTPTGGAQPPAAPQTATGAIDQPAPGAPTVNTTAPRLTLRYVAHKKRPAADFKRVAEYFTGQPENGDDIVLHSDPAARDGSWFTFAIGLTEDLPTGTTARLELIRSDLPGPQKYAFRLPAVTGAAMTREFHLGLTGKDALAPKASITAWKLTLIDTTGRELAGAQSFLWAMPTAVK